jgi:hypothetical protein
MAVKYTPTANTKVLYHLENTDDSSGNGFNLTEDGSGITYPAGKFRNCADLGNPNGLRYLYNTSNIGIAGDAAQTMIFWVKLNAEIGSGYYRLFQKADNSKDISYDVIYQYNGGTRRFLFERWRVNVAQDQIFSNATLGATDWHMVAIVYTGTVLRTFLDGALAGTPLTCSGDGSGYSDKIQIGTYDGGIEKAPAQFDEVIIEDRAWSDTEILAYFNAVAPAGGGFLMNFMG